MIEVDHEAGGDYKVLTICFTYNQELYIEDALKGFVRQKTNFPYCALVVDDCSTDHNADIIRAYEQEYPNVIKGIYLPENMYNNPQKKMAYVQPWIEHSQYLSYCEGDDYWIDDNKLQRQVDFLDAHPDYMMHFHNALVRQQNHSAPDRLISHFETGDFSTARIFEKWQLPFASILIRKEILDSKIYKDLTNVFSGVICFFIAASRLGKVYGLSECLSVYRRNEGGISLLMTPSYCMELECKYAKASGDVDAVKVVGKKIALVITGWCKQYIKRDAEAIKFMKVVRTYYPRVFYIEFIRYLLWIPIRWLKKIKKICQ